MKHIQLFLIIAIISIQGCISSKSAYSVDDFQCYPQAVYLFRHAEKQKIKGEKNPELTKEGFIEENDIRCKKEGQVFSDFPPGTYCSGYGKIKIL